jgi:hypothetical protein
MYADAGLTVADIVRTVQGVTLARTQARRA